ncbi:response regulator transcription factor [Novispirillum sp. DQ9]|uniref:response regulator transcription factor n=1 Tax=Novispirillum sp. DQ9 TaxID=3398612 RepID=UPI003C7D7710
MRALVADDHSVVRLALRHILADLDPAVEVSEAADASEVLSALAAAPVDMAIIDIFMPSGGIDFVSRIVAAAAPAPVVVFTMSEDPRHAQAAIAAGARAFVPKTTAEGLIVNILRLVLAGGIYLPPAMTLASASDAERGSGARRALGLPGDGPLSQVDLAGSPSGRLPQLTPRQHEVLELMAQGLSNADIGARLGLNLSTVKSHVTGVLRALNVSSRTQAVLAFKRTEWSPPPTA